MKIKYGKQTKIKIRPKEEKKKFRLKIMNLEIK